MRDTIARSLSDSSRDFVNLVWPAIKHLLGGGDIEAVEAVTTDRTTERLDWLAGIDAWHYLADDGGMRGIASRVQWLDPRFAASWPWRTFTIRRSLASGRPTEWHKRLEAVMDQDRGLLYPHLTIQAYLRAKVVGPVDSVGVVRTEDLVRYVDDNRCRIRKTRSGETFFVIGWDELRCRGVRIAEYDAKAEVA